MNEQEKRVSGMNRDELLNKYQELLASSVRDSLTGLLNRGTLEKEINARLLKKIPGDSCALFIIDLDNFKAVNDTFGHQTGDSILNQAAKQLSDMFYAADIVGRLGGDELLVFLCGNLTESVIRSKAQRICDRIQFSVGDSGGIVVTCSIGICYNAAGEQTFENYYHIADHALYEVKNNGKRGYCIKREDNPDNEPYTKTDEAISVMQLNSLLESTDSGVGMVEISKYIHFVYVSPVLARMVKSAVSDMLGKSALEYVHPDDRALIESGIRERIIGKNESSSYVVRILDAEGGIIWGRIFAVRAPDESNRPAILITVTDITDLKQKEADLQMDNYLFQSVLEQTTQGLWELEPTTHVFRMISGAERFSDIISKSMSFPEGLIEIGLIAPESADNLRGFAKEIFEGSSGGYGIFKIQYASERYEWAAFSYKTIYNEDTPAKIVGIIESMESAEIEHKHSVKRTNLPNNLMENIILQASGNLTDNTMYGCYVEGKELTGGYGLNSCTDFFDSELDHIYLQEEIGLLTRLLSKDAMLRMYLNQGNTWLTQEYRRVDNTGNIQWVSCVLNVYPDKITGDIMFSMWQSKIENRRKWEFAFNVPVYKEPISKLYTRLTVRELATRLMANKDGRLCAVAVIKIGGLEKFYSREPKSVNKKWSSLMTALVLSLGSDCIPGQIDANTIVVFFPEISGKQTLKKRIVQAFLFVRGVTSDIFSPEDLHFAAGCVVGNQSLSDYSEMLKKAHKQCEYKSSASSDCVMFANDKDDNPEKLKESREDDEITTRPTDIERQLSADEQTAAIQCFVELFNCETIDKSARILLSALGTFYRADRVYMLETVERGQVVIMPFEWTCEGKRSVQTMINGSPTKSFPLIARCIQENRPIFVSRKKNAESEKEWRFAIFPMYNGKDIESFLCIENNGVEIPDAALTMLLSSCFQQERRKHGKHTGMIKSGYSAMDIDLPNLKHYNDVIVNFTSDVYTSLGVVSVDLPSYSTINSTEGFDRGRKILWDIIGALRKNFGKAMIFRTWDAEFTALCPNTTHTAFTDKYNRMYGMLKRHYPTEIRIGQAWSDKIFAGTALAEEARLIMRCDGSTENNLITSALPESLSKYNNAREMISAGRFTVYYQPKVDMETGVIVGAEALIRGLDENNHIISPGYFVEEMERSGAVKELDLFVLDYTMRMLTKWKEENIPLIPISINFSRVTLFDPRVPASVIAIQSRYPEFEKGVIEIEITEGAMDVNREAMVDVMDSYREMGFTFSMDDFGSKYSNLAAFTSVKFETIKIDRSLVKDIVSNRTNQMLVKDIADICLEKKVNCIAEGVETLDQIKSLIGCGCNVAQGYYFHHPLPPELFKEKYMKQLG